MSVVGSWKITVKSPMGTTISTLTITEEGGTYRGTMSRDDGSTEVEDLTVDGTTVSYKVDVPSPMGQLKVTMNGNVEGDKISGNVETPIGPIPFSGERV